jgi:glutathione S-transferase
LITLYELHWSHYCEKVRWALRLKGVSWRAVNINAFSKRELMQFPPGPSGLRLVPMIHDEHTGRHVYESTAILKYLDQTYGPAVLFPGDPEQAETVERLLIELDTYLALASRRLGYAQLILECPTALAKLFLSSLFRGILTLPGIDRIASAIMGMMLLKRFDLHKNEQLGLYEAVARYLEHLQLRLANRRYLVGDALTGADIALASQLRPLTIVPSLIEQPQLKPLFEWRERLIRDHGGEPALRYEELIAQVRQRSSPMRRRTREATADISSIYSLVSPLAALNDQNPIWTWSAIKVPFWYFRTLRKHATRRSSARAP